MKQTFNKPKPISNPTTPPSVPKNAHLNTIDIGTDSLMRSIGIIPEVVPSNIEDTLNTTVRSLVSIFYIL